MAKAEADTKDQRADAEPADDAPVDDETAKKAAQRLADESNPPDEQDPDEQPDPEDDEEVDDETVKAWLKEVVATPEIKSVIREAAKEAAKRSKDRTEREVRAELEESFSKRLEKIEKDLKSGKITPDEATARAEKDAERAARDLNKDTDDDDDADEKRRTDEREAKLRLRELNAYKREAVASEDQNKIVEDVIVVTADMDEDDVDDLIEKSKEVFSKVRKQVIAELRSQGWKSPRDLRSLAAEPSPPAADDEDDDDDEEGPPSRDRRETGGLTPSRKRNLRSRFGYASKEERQTRRR